MLAGIVTELFGEIVAGLVVGVSSTQVSKDMRMRPNQRTRNSGWNALRFGLVYELFGGLFVGLVYELTTGLVYNLVVGGLFAGLIVGLFFGLLFGGQVYFSHYVLRYILSRNGAMP